MQLFPLSARGAAARARRVSVRSRGPTGFGQSFSPPSYFDTGWASVFVAGCEAIGANPYDVAGLLMNESGFSPAAQNSIRCVGLNQECPGSQNFISDYSASDYLNLPVSQQLPYVFAFWQNWLSQYGLITISARDLYWLNWLPATYVPNSSDSYVISTQGDAWYSSNTSLDNGSKGYITAGDLDTAIQNQKTNNPDLYSYLATQITIAGGPLAYFSWPWFAAGTFAAGFVGYYAWEKWGGRRPAWIPAF